MVDVCINKNILYFTALPELLLMTLTKLQTSNEYSVHEVSKCKSQRSCLRVTITTLHFSFNTVYLQDLHKHVMFTNTKNTVKVDIMSTAAMFSVKLLCSLSVDNQEILILSH